MLGQKQFWDGLPTGIFFSGSIREDKVHIKILGWFVRDVLMFYRTVRLQVKFWGSRELLGVNDIGDVTIGIRVDPRGFTVMCRSSVRAWRTWREPYVDIIWHFFKTYGMTYKPTLNTWTWPRGDVPGLRWDFIIGIRPDVHGFTDSYGSCLRVWYTWCMCHVWTWYNICTSTKRIDMGGRSWLVVDWRG